MLHNIGQTQFAYNIETVMANPMLKQRGRLVKLLRLSIPVDFHDSMQQGFYMGTGQTCIYSHCIMIIDI